jgi:hypothetical protein
MSKKGGAMTAPKKSPASVGLNGDARSLPPVQIWGQFPVFSPEQIKKLVAELEVPFDPSVIEWRVTATTEDKTRGRILPYADPRAYTDRLNGLFTPHGWTRKYRVTTSPNFERSDDHKVVAKVLVTCEVIIFGLGSHSATGEDWADNPNALTSAEAHAFKRSCSCFGLGRYLYSFGPIWVDLNERGWPGELPVLQNWATPEGWRNGLRPSPKEQRADRGPSSKKPRFFSRRLAAIQQIEAMEEPLGKKLYHGVLRDLARVWNPADIKQTAPLNKVLAAMQSAERDLGRLEATRQKVGPEALNVILHSRKLRSIVQVDNLEMLRQLVSAVEEQANQLESA